MLHVAAPLPLARGSFPRFGNTPPQPDTCHRDSSLSKDAFVPPDSSAAAGSRNSTSLEGSEESSKILRDAPAPHGEHCVLIPGLSDDVALLCLARIGRSAWPACRAVSASWNSLFSSPAYHALRTTLGTTEPWLYVRGSLKGSPVSSWHALDLQSATWHPLPPLPACAVTTAGSRSTVLDGCLYAVGGMELNHSTAVASVYRYDPLSATWTHCPPLGTPRGYSAVESLAGSLYVAGGNGYRGCEITSVENYTPPRPIPHPPSRPEAAGGDGRKIGELTIHEYDPRCAICHASTDSRTGNGISGWFPTAPALAPAPAPAPAPAASGWDPLSPLPSEMAAFDSVVVGGEILVTEGWHWPYHYSPRGFIFNPGGGGTWRTMPLPLSEGWVGRAVNRDGRFLMLHTEQGLARASDGTARSAFIEEFDFTTATWRSLEASPFPRKVTGKLRVALVRDKVVAVGEEMQVAVGSMRGVGAVGVPEVSWELLPTSKRPTNVDPEVCHVIVS